MKGKMMGWILLAAFVAAWVVFAGYMRDSTGVIRHGGGFIVGCLAMIAAGFFGGVYDKNQDSPPKTIHEISERIASVDDAGDVLRITLDAQTALLAKHTFNDASRDAYKITKQIIQHFPDTPHQAITYVLNAEVQDNYGNQSVAPVLALTYRMDEMRKVNFANLYHTGLLQLAEPIEYRGRAGRQIVKAWCDDKGNGTASGRFCRINTGP